MNEDDSIDAQIVALAADLFERRSSGVIVPGCKVSIGNWRPAEHECHDNAEIWAAHSPGDRRVRGFLLFDYLYQLPTVQFAAHSVIRQPNGALIDITPTNASQRYPFIEHTGSLELFAEAEKRRNIYHPLQ